MKRNSHKVFPREVPWKLLGRLVLVALALAAFPGCTSIKGTVPAPPPPKPAGSFQAGAAVADITPIPGFATGGHSFAGAVARGFWTRLKARAIYLQDAQGNDLALVACDLWSLPAGLGDRVAELLGTNSPAHSLGRDQIILAATHTHQSPGNFSTCEGYNLLASCKPGFDPRLFEFLARQITNAIVEAARSKQDARVFFGETVVTNVARNRSFPAFVRNPECELLLRENESLPPGPRLAEYPDLDTYRAVDPRLKVLRVERAAGSTGVIAVAAFFAVHATAMPHTLPFYSSDLFGVATAQAERELRAAAPAAARPPVVALFNGAEGDVSPAWTNQCRAETRRIGEAIAKEIVRLCAGTAAGLRVDGAISFRFTNAPLTNVAFLDGGGCEVHTARSAMLGASALGGAEDGRTDLFWKGYVEGMAGTPSGEQGAKLNAFDVHYIGLPILSPLGQMLAAVAKLPQQAPVGVYRIGDNPNVVLATLPGEFTTVMGRRIAAGITTNLPAPPAAAVLPIGLANEYVSYFTTPEEYQAQHYEGASTLYGSNAAPAVARHLTDLAGRLREPRPPPLSRNFSYSPGITHHFGAEDFAHEPADAAAKAVELIREGQPCVRSREWEDALPDFKAAGGKPVVPCVVIGELDAAGEWHPLKSDGVVESNQGLDFVTLITHVQGKKVRWQAVWFPPSQPLSGPLRFRVTTPDNRVRWVDPL